MSLETLIADLAKNHYRFEVIQTSEEGVVSYQLTNPPIDKYIQLNVCGDSIDLFVGAKSLYFNQYGKNTVKDIKTIIDNLEP